MDNRGIALMISLWISAAAAAVALAALAAARDGAASAAVNVLDARALYAATAAALLSHSANLSQPAWEREMGDCQVRTETRVSADGRTAVLTCDIRTQRLRRHVDIGWTRTAGDWSPAWWRER